MGRLFGTSGIRGKYPEEVSPQLAYRLGLAVARYASRGSAATVGYDTRTTGPLLASMVAAGLMAGGSNVIELGLAPTPVIAYSVPETGSKAGVAVTASHNPPHDNGLKVFDGSGSEYTEEMEEELEKLIIGTDESELLVSWDCVGRAAEGGTLVDAYVTDVVSRLEPAERRLSPTVVVDCANGAASRVTPALLRMLGAKVVTLNCHEDGYFPGRIPEPRPDVLEGLKGIAQTVAAEAALAHDGDADRLAVVTPKHGFINQSRLIAFYALLKLRDRKGTIVVSVDVGKAVEDVVNEHGGRLVRAKLGKTHSKLKEVGDALLAAEPWKLIDPSWGPWADGIYQAALIVKTMVEEGKDLGSLLETIPDYPHVRASVIVEGGAQKAVASVAIDELRSRASEGANVLEIDGLRVDYEDGSWVLVRASGTEPKVRLYAEARSERRLYELVSWVLNLIREGAERLGVRIRGVEGLDPDKLAKAL